MAPATPPVGRRPRLPDAQHLGPRPGASARKGRAPEAGGAADGPVRNGGPPRAARGPASRRAVSAPAPREGGGPRWGRGGPLRLSALARLGGVLRDLDPKGVEERSASGREPLLSGLVPRASQSQHAGALTPARKTSDPEVTSPESGLGPRGGSGWAEADSWEVCWTPAPDSVME